LQNNQPAVNPGTYSLPPSQVDDPELLEFAEAIQEHTNQIARKTQVLTPLGSLLLLSNYRLAVHPALLQTQSIIGEIALIFGDQASVLVERKFVTVVLVQIPHLLHLV
jgi:hypothetical protein